MSANAAAGWGADNNAYQNPALPLEDRVSNLLAQMTLDEKIALVHADSKFTTAALPRFNLPRRWMSDGPQGVREDIGPDTWAPAGHTNDFSTAMPANLGLAASFDPQLATAYGNVIGEEAKTRGKNIMLCPAVNIMRTPLNGRSSEYFGEDPFLASRMAVAYIKAVQSHGVASCVKHFAANNQETDRNTIDVEVDDRALHEIYLPAFKAAVTEAHAWCVMTAYNKLRGTFCSESDLLLNHILKTDWQFPGLVMSDWSGTHSTINAANHGLDLEMGTDKPYNDFYFADALRTAVEKHEVSEDRLDDMARRNLRVMFATGMFDPHPTPPGITTLPTEHLDAARRIEESAIVLLKNDHATLPFDASKIKRLLVVGELADSKTAHDGNSAAIKTHDEITPLQGIQKFLGPNVQVTHSLGYASPTRRRNRNAQQPDAPTLLQNAVNAAKGADAVIVIAGLYRAQDQEGEDRKNMLLPQSQVDLLTAIAAVNPRTAVVLTGGAVEMDPWLAKTPALLEYWYGGTEGGDALANVLFGKVNPSAKLPCTFPKTLADSPAHAGNDPSHYPGEGGKETYAEGIFVGYRWFDAKKIEPLFPFGYGLSYTTFACSDLHVTPGENGNATVQVTVANTGQREGAGKSFSCTCASNVLCARPEHELKGFQKIQLQPGEHRTISIPLNAASFSYYDPKQSAWVAEAGEFGIDVGSSSRDLPLHGTYQLAQTLATKDGR